MSTPPNTGSPSPPQDLTPLQITALQALPAPPTQPSTNPRRLPPPCWTPDETVALIDAYRDKWYTLRRGNLKANHWQEVADAVARRCPAASPPKTAVQCRHKMEKLRKRYRTEIQRARSMPVSRFASSWVHFKRMDGMEKGPQAKADYNSESEGDDNEDDNEDDGDIHGSYLENYRTAGNVMNTRSIQKLYRNGIGNPGTGSGNNGLSGGNSSLGSGNAGGFRIRIPTGVSIAQPGPKFYAKPEQKYGGGPSMGVNASPNPNLKPNYGGMGSSSRVMRGGEEMGKKREREPMEELVAAIKVLGDGFVRMEEKSVGCVVFTGSNGLDDTEPMIYSLTLSRFINHYKHISFCHRININISMSFETIRQTHSKSHHHQASLKSLCSTTPSLLSLVLLKHLYTHLCILKTSPSVFLWNF